MTGPAARSTYDTVRDGIDLVAVQRYIDNDRPLPHLEHHEREPVARAMHEASIPVGEIATRLGTYERAIDRWIEKWKSAP